MAVSLVTNIFKPFKAYLNPLNITNFIYIDDGLIINPDSKLLSAQIKFVFSVLAHAGWKINEEKNFRLSNSKVKAFGNVN